MNKMVDLISNYYTMVSTCMMYVGMLMFNIGPTFNNVRNTVFLKTENYSMEYSVYYSYPGFKPLDYVTIASIYNCYLSYNCSTLLCGFDLLLFLMIFQTIGHVYILRHNLENFPSPNNKIMLTFLGDKYRNKEGCICEKFDPEENKLVSLKLAECIEHHKIIIRFVICLFRLR